MKTLIPVMLLLFLAACDKNDADPVDRTLSGNYTGTFFRTGMDTTAVTISFSNNTFRGPQNGSTYPAICRGSFIMDDHQVSFSDSCVWKADFDWSLILDGNYSVDFLPGGGVRIWRTNGYSRDEYLLRRTT